MKNPHFHLWAKSEVGNNGCGCFHPLICHSLDIASIATLLCDSFLSPGRLRFFSDCFKSEQVSDACKFLPLICALHDIGKATPSFQLKNSGLFSELCSTFNIPPESQSEIPHNIFSEFILKRELNEILGGYFSPTTLPFISKAIGGHHGSFSHPKIMQRVTTKSCGNNEFWSRVRKSILTDLCQVLDLSPPSEPLEIKDGKSGLVLQFWLCGFITFTDWISSVEDFYPYFVNANNPDELDLNLYYNRSLQRARRALDQIGFNEYKNPGIIPEFSKLFDGFQPRIQQNEIFESVKKIESGCDPVLIIVEAPMGLGKTETAFIVSEMLNTTRQVTGTYIAMPTQATSNQMYQRYCSFLEARFPPTVPAYSLLLHSGSNLFLNRNNTIPSAIAQDNDTSSDFQIESHDWFQNKKRGLLASFAVGTIDQMLMSVLRSKHNYLRLFGLAGKCVIIDEVHSYDVYMSTLLSHFLKWAAELHISVILLSATLPAIKKQELIEAFKCNPPESLSGYPRLTIAKRSCSSTELITPPSSKELKLTQVIGISDEELIHSLHSRVSNGGYLAVVCNTVSRAQNLYSCFKSACSDTGTEVWLLHARFPADIRAELEEKIIKRFGKVNKERKGSVVLFSTQIIEQSLDIDFDSMVSELCPVDLLLQRAGRLHRFMDIQRPDNMCDPLLEVIIPSDAIDKFRGNPAEVYSKNILYRTYLSIRNQSLIRIPDDIDQLIEAVYNVEMSLTENPEEIQALQLLEAEYQSKLTVDRKNAEGKVIPEPDCEDPYLEDSRLLLDEDDPIIHQNVMAATRLTAPSVRVVCVMKKDECHYFINKSGTLYDMSLPLTEEVVENAVKASLSLSGNWIFNAIMNDQRTVPPSVWKKSPMLRYHRILVFEEGKCSLNNITISYDNNLGVYYEKNMEE